MARLIDGGPEGYIYEYSDEIRRKVEDLIFPTQQTVHIEEIEDDNEEKDTILDVEYFLQEYGLEVVSSRQDDDNMEVTFRFKGKKYTIKYFEEDQTYIMFTPLLMLQDSAYGNGTPIYIPHTFIEVLKAWIKELEENIN